MPFYEYECQSCKFYTELMQKISDPPLEKCPSCGKKTMQKLISAPVFRLKGSGWYETDFKGDNENKRNLAGADKEESKSDDSSSSSGSSGKSDSKTSDSKDSKDTKEDSKSKAPAVETKTPVAGKSSGGSSSGKSSVRPSASKDGGSSKGGSSSKGSTASKGGSKAKPAAATANRRGGSRTVSKPKAKAKGKAGKGRR